MKSFSKRVASFTMAAAMVLSLAAVSPVDAQAAKKASITKKTSITAGKTYTYKIKNVTSKQYVKVTGITSGVKVKYNNKTVKKNSTKIYGKKSGAALALKVTAKDKVANYKATIKAQVYNKSNNKKVGSLLKTTTKVKCTKLAIDSVESAAINATVNGAGIKYLVVKFNRAMDSLDASEVEIRNANTQQLSTVGKVTLAKNGKSATVELLGAEDSTIVDFLTPNTDYIMTIDKDSAKASLKFYVEGVCANAVVTGVDAAKNKIKVSGTSYTVPASIGVDYADILGRTVTFWYDKDQNISKLIVADETAVYGAYNVVSTNIAGNYSNPTATFVDKADGNIKYVANTEVTITNKSTSYINANGSGYTAAVSGDSIDYAKIILNPNGSIRTAVVAKPTSVYQMTSISNTTIRESATASKNLKDFMIVKDGKKIAVDAINTNDVVFVDNTNSFAEVYTSKVEGVITKVTDEKITIDGKEYKYKTTAGVQSKYIDGDQTKEANEDYFINLKNAAKTATVYLNRTGLVVRASGDQGVAVTNTKEYVLTTSGNSYAAANKNFIQLTGSNGTETSIPAFALEDIKTINVSGNKFYRAGNDVSSNKANEFACTTFAPAVAWGAISNTSNSVSLTKTSVENTLPFTSFNVDSIFGDATLVKVTTDDKNAIVGIEAVNAANVRAVSTNFVVKAGLTTVLDNANKSYQIKSTTMVYDISTKDGASVVTATKLADMTKATDKTKDTFVKFYVDNGNVTAVIIDNRGNNNAYGFDGDKTVKGIVKDIQRSKDKVCDLTLITASGEQVFTSFGDVTTTAAVGQVVEVKYNGTTNTVKTISGGITKANHVSSNTCVSTNNMAVVDNKITLCDNSGNNNVTYKLSESENPVIVKIDNGAVVQIDYSELQNIKHDTTNYANTNVEVYSFSEGDIVNFVIVKAGF